MRLPLDGAFGLRRRSSAIGRRVLDTFSGIYHGIGDRVAGELKVISPKYNQGRRVNILSQRLSYLVRCGDPDAFDSIVPMAYGTVALDLVLAKKSGFLVNLQNGKYGSVPIDVLSGQKKIVNVGKYYNTDRLRPKYETFSGKPFFIMTSDI